MKLPVKHIITNEYFHILNNIKQILFQVIIIITELKMF